MLKKVILNTSKKRRKRRVKGKLNLSNLLRVSVFKSNKYFYAQIIDDAKAETLVSVGPKDGNTLKELAKKLTQKALKANIKKVKFDRGSYHYHGKVKEFCENLREEGLEL